MEAVGIRSIEFNPTNNLTSPPNTYSHSFLLPPPPRCWQRSTATATAAASTYPCERQQRRSPALLRSRLTPFFDDARRRIPLPISPTAAYKGGGEMVGPSRPVIVLFGSSVVQYSFSNGGWGATLADIYARKADIVLRGYIGWNSRRAVEVLDKVFPKDEPVQPSLVIVYFGGNDSMGPHPSGRGPHVPLPEYVENMRKIATHLKSLSEKTRIIFLSCPPVNEEMLKRLQSKALAALVRTNEICHQYSEACIKLCEELDIEVVDLWTAMQKRDDWQNVCFTDGVHLTSEGSNIVVKEVLNVIKEADWQPSLYWKSLPTEFSEDSPYDLVAADGVSTLNPSDWTFHREIQWD